jgi:3-oxoadipate CoA-transferase beta subunit
MDLAAGARTLYVMMSLFDKSGSSKLVTECTYPLTGRACVSRIYTDHAVVDLGPDGAVVLETYGSTVDQLARRLPVPLLPL